MCLQSLAIGTCQLTHKQSLSSRMYPIVHCYNISPFGHLLLSLATIQICQTTVIGLSYVPSLQTSLLSATSGRQTHSSCLQRRLHNGHTKHPSAYSFPDGKRSRAREEGRAGDGAGISIFVKIAPVSVGCDEWARFGLPLPVGFRRFIPGDRFRRISLSVKCVRGATNYRLAYGRARRLPRARKFGFSTARGRRIDIETY